MPVTVDASAAFSLRRPAGEESPVLVEVPHAGLIIPEPIAGELEVSADSVLKDSDIYVDRLYADAPEVGASLLCARVSRYVIDLNRAPDDVDRETVADHPAPRGVQPRGVVWRTTPSGRPALTRPLRYDDLRRRLALFHTPYHQALREEIERKRARFGYAIVVAAHSMPSVSAGGNGNPRADVVPGTRGRSSADERVIDLVDHCFRSAGLSVRHDDPYRGGYTTAHYGRPAEGQHVVQIELNRALYVQESTGRPIEPGFSRTRALVTELVATLGDLRL